MNTQPTNLPEKILAIKVDIDTDRGTRIGVNNLLQVFAQYDITTTFLFSLGPDRTGQAIKRIFRPGFLKKIYRSRAIKMYGIQTLLNGLLLPAPHIGKRNQNIMYRTHIMGHEVGIHSYDHIRWQDHLHSMLYEEIWAECMKAQQEFKHIFGHTAKVLGAAGWKANAFSLSVYDEMKLLYGSDTRGHYPFFPRLNGIVFRTLQIPTTLPTLDELLGRKEYPLPHMIQHYLGLLRADYANVLTIHAEIEGMEYLQWFESFLQQALSQRVKIVALNQIANQCLTSPQSIPICELTQEFIDGRSGKIATQKVLS